MVASAAGMTSCTGITAARIALGVRLVLASASPRRAELLRAAGIEFDVLIANVDESARPGETPAQHVARLAEEKAFRVLPQAGRRPVLGADTVVVVDDHILGKPADAADAARMLRMLAGRKHQVMTGVALIPTVPQVDSIAVHDGIEVTTVEFAPLSDAEITAYVSSGEPMDKAGAYAIQGLASLFVTRIEGSYANVVGLPVALVYNLCKRAGLLVS
jgi:septum formation protein